MIPSYKMNGVAKQIGQLANLQRNMPAQFEAAQLAVAEEVVRDDVYPATPIEFGDLRESLEAVPDTSGSNQHQRKYVVRIRAGFRGRSRQYALIVHENPDAHHPIGGWKYIEYPMKRVAPQWSRRVAAKLDIKRARG